MVSGYGDGRTVRGAVVMAEHSSESETQQKSSQYRCGGTNIGLTTSAHTRARKKSLLTRRRRPGSRPRAHRPWKKAKKKKRNKQKKKKNTSGARAGGGVNGGNMVCRKFQSQDANPGGGWAWAKTKRDASQTVRKRHLRASGPDKWPEMKKNRKGKGFANNARLQDIVLDKRRAAKGGGGLRGSHLFKESAWLSYPRLSTGR